MLRSTFFPDVASNEERRSLKIFQTEREIATYIDALDLGEGEIITDTAYAYSVVMASKNPRQFIVTSDRDFQASARDPRGRKVRFMLVPIPSLGPADSLQRQWPALYESGAGIGVLEKEWKAKFFGDWRLYRVE